MAVSDITVLIIAGFAIGLAIRQQDRFVGNLSLFLCSLGTLLVLTGNEALVSAVLILITLGNLIYSLLTTK